MDYRPQLFGAGIVGALLGGPYKLIRWIIELRRERQRGGEGQPSIIIPPGGDVLAVALPDPLDSPLNDRRIPYVERLPGRSVRRAMEDLLLQQRALLVCGKSGLGKTREAAHLAQTPSAEGWTVLYLPPDRWLEPPAHRLEGVPDHKLLLFVDDLSRRCGSGRREVNPRADSLAQPLTLPFQERLLKTLRACFAAICGDIEEALRLLDIALPKRQTSRQWARQAPDLRALHGHPRFEQLTASFPTSNGCACKFCKHNRPLANVDQLAILSSRLWMAAIKLKRNPNRLAGSDSVRTKHERSLTCE